MNAVDLHSRQSHLFLKENFMKKFINYVAAAAMTVGGFALTNTARADDTVGQKVGNAVDNTKNAAKNQTGKWENGRVYTLLGQITNDALNKGGLDNLASHFNDADRDRIKPWLNDNDNKAAIDKLDGRIDQFQKDWKAKYNQDFKISKDDVVFGNPMFTVAQGEIGKDARLAGEKLPAADQSHPVTGGDKNLEKGRNVAVVTVAASHDLPELKVPLIHELPDMWKIDVPDSVDGKTFYTNMLTHLTMVDENKAQWPADVNDAYRMVTHHVLMATLNVDKDTNGAAATPGAGTAKPIDQK
jgi:hypothetical protein